jgi:autotransporter-associated beta strand protein
LTLSGPTETAAANVTISAPLGGSAGLTKGGGAILTLSGGNTYSGTTLVQNGTLNAANASGVSLPGAVTLGNGSAAVHLNMGASNQFASGSVLTMANGAQNNKFQLRGTNQTIAGLSSAATNTLSIIQNDEIGTPGYTSAPGAAVLTIDAATDFSFYGITRTQNGGTLSLVKEGAGTQELRNSVTAVGIAHNGTTTINNGKLLLNLAGVNNGFNSDVTVNSAGTLGLAGDFNMGRLITGGGAVVKEGVGTVTMNGAVNNTYTGLTTVTAGTLVAARSGGAVSIPGNVVIGDASGNDVLRLGATNAIATTSTITFNSAGTGGNGGKLELGGFNQTVAGISSTGGVSLIQNFEIGGSGNPVLTVSNAVDQTFDGIIRNGGGGTVGLTKTGVGTLTILNSTTVAGNSYSGLTTVSQGTLQFGNAAAGRRALGSGTIQIDGGGNVLIWNNNAQTHGNTLTGTGSLHFRSNSSASSGGGNEHIITGANGGYSGAITVTDSRLRVQDASSRLGNASVTNTITTAGNGQLMYNGAGTYHYNVIINGMGYYETGGVDRFGALRLEAGAVQAGSVTLSGNAGIGSHQTGGTISGVISDGVNDFSVTKLGVNQLTLTNVNTYSGDTYVAAGTLALTGSGSIANSPVIDVAAGATLDVSGTSSTWGVGSGQTLQGSGVINGNFSVAGIVAPGNSPGTLTTLGNLWLEAGSEWQVEIGGLLENEFDRLSVGGTLDAGGQISISLTNGFTPLLGDSFEIAEFAGFADSGYVFDFGSAGLSSGLFWDTSEFSSNGIISVIPEPTTAFLSCLGALGLLRRRR